MAEKNDVALMNDLGKDDDFIAVDEEEDNSMVFVVTQKASRAHRISINASKKLKKHNKPSPTSMIKMIMRKEAAKRESGKKKGAKGT